MHKIALTFVVLGLLIAGCGKGKDPKLAEVSGTVVDSAGNPLAEVKVQFLPDPEKEVFGGPASGETDASGKFTLYYKDDKSKPGTAVGVNRVILTDLMSIRTSRDEEPVRRRFHKKYIAAKTTDLSFNVQDEDGQEFEIKVEGTEQ